MELHLRAFSELTTIELFKIYEARTKVFVVEQTCPYQEVDTDDLNSYHLWFEENGTILAYLRMIMDGGTECAHIGRVLSFRRREGLATELVKEAIAFAHTLGLNELRLGAQCYAKSLYEKLGFISVGETYLLDDIPHIDMLLSLN